MSSQTEIMPPLQSDDFHISIEADNFLQLRCWIDSVQFTKKKIDDDANASEMKRKITFFPLYIHIHSICTENKPLSLSQTANLK